MKVFSYDDSSPEYAGEWRYLVIAAMFHAEQHPDETVVLRDTCSNREFHINCKEMTNGRN